MCIRDRVALRFAIEKSVELKKNAIDEIDRLLPVFRSEHPVEKECRAAAKTLVAAVEAAIDRLEILKDSTAYAFGVNLHTALDKYFGGVKSNPDEMCIRDRRISFKTSNGKVQAVRDIGFDLYRGETLAIVGESGSGKSVTSRAILGILAGNAIVEGGSILYGGQDLLRITEEDFQKIRGDRIAMIFQDPLSLSLIHILSMFYTFIGLVGSLVIDMSYGIIDPRIRMGER